MELSQPANNISNNELYGVIPYIAPEVLKRAKSSKESDIYSMGMIMWELTTGCKPFANVEHDHRLMYEIIDGERPEITNDTPKCFANLMKKCLDSDPSKRPSITEFCDYWYIWYHYYQLDQAEKTRLELINLGELGPKFNEKPHPKAIYTSRPLKSLITKCSSFNTISTIDISNGNNIDEFLCTKRFNHINELIDHIKNIEIYFNPLDVYTFINEKIDLKSIIKWIPYTQLKNFKEIARGGFNTIYRATWSDDRTRIDGKLGSRTVAIKRFSHPQDFSKYFLNEVIIFNGKFRHRWTQFS